MDASKVRPGDWIAALGGVVLLVALFFLDWYRVELSIAPLEIGSSFLVQEPPTEIPGLEELTEIDDLNAWDEQGFLGTIANLVMLAAGVWAIVAVGLRAGTGGAQSPAETATATAVLGIAASVMVLLRIVFPVDEIEGLEVDTSLKFGIFVALVGAILIAIGGLWSRGAAPTAPPRARAAEPPPPPGPPPSGEPPPPPRPPGSP
jgi:hypothetical protein